MNRKPISKKTRFEVFKRDKFTCQYCGASAPEVVMEIDHIVPVASGGDSNIMNLITSCYSCNRGKSYRELSDNSALAKQKKQLDNLQERKEQLQLLAKWRKGLIDLDTETVKIVCSEIENCYQNQYSISESGKMNIAKWLKKFTLQELFEAIRVSSQYLEIKKESYTKEIVTLAKSALENGYTFDELRKEIYNADSILGYRDQLEDMS